MPVQLSDQIQDEENVEQGTEEKDTDSVHKNEVNSKDSEVINYCLNYSILNDQTIFKYFYMQHLHLL